MGISESWVRLHGDALGLEAWSGAAQRYGARAAWRLDDGIGIRLRPARPDDRPLEQALVRLLSPKSRYYRFFSSIPELTPELLARFTRFDPPRAMTLLAVIEHDIAETAVGMAHCVADPYPRRCEIALVVADAWQRNGIGRQLMHALVWLAGAAGLRRIEGEVLAENVPILRLLHAMGFETGRYPDSALLRRARKLGGAAVGDGRTGVMRAAHCAEWAVSEDGSAVEPRTPSIV